MFGVITENMIIKHEVKDIFPIKGKLHIPDVIGMKAAHQLKPGKLLPCVFQSPNGEQYEMMGKVAFELINYKGRAENMEKIGGSLIFDDKPNGQTPSGWKLFVHIESDEKL
jgi:hypothetical protein